MSHMNFFALQQAPSKGSRSLLTIIRVFIQGLLLLQQLTSRATRTPQPNRVTQCASDSNTSLLIFDSVLSLNTQFLQYELVLKQRPARKSNGSIELTVSEHRAI